VHVDFFAREQLRVAGSARASLDAEHGAQRGLAQTRDEWKKPGAPTGWRMNAREVQVRAGAGYLVVLAGKMVLMPGLPEVGRFADIDLSADGFITGLK